MKRIKLTSFPTIRPLTSRPALQRRQAPIFSSHCNRYGFKRLYCASCAPPPPLEKTPQAAATASTQTSLNSTTTTTISSENSTNTAVKKKGLSVTKTLHHELATKQQLYTTSPLSPGSPLFLPHGTRIFNKLLDFLRAQYALYGYEEVVTPTIYKDELWKQSGHWENFREDMFRVVGGEEAGTEEGSGGYGLKPMNCPGHCLLFKAQSFGYRDLPVRYADFSPLHRNEIQSALTGLTRVRRFHQDDAHIFCRPSQIAAEISATLDLLQKVYSTFSLTNYALVLSTRPANFLGDISTWSRAEEALKQALIASGKEWSINEGDGAFYGPKIDIILTDSTGKRHQTATIQLDFQLPERFGLGYLSPAPDREAKGEMEMATKEEMGINGLVRPVIVHRAVLGSVERFMALLIEQFAVEGRRWPWWISPRQAVVIGVGGDEEVRGYAKMVRERLAGLKVGEGRQPIGRERFFVDLDLKDGGVGMRRHEAVEKGYNTVVVVGKRDMAAGVVSWETWDGEGYAKRASCPVEKLYDVFVEGQRGYRDVLGSDSPKS